MQGLPSGLTDTDLQSKLLFAREQHRPVLLFRLPQITFPDGGGCQEDYYGKEYTFNPE
jgi:hypothetical protein